MTGWDAVRVVPGAQLTLTCRIKGEEGQWKEWIVQYGSQRLLIMTNEGQYKEFVRDIAPLTYRNDSFEDFLIRICRESESDSVWAMDMLLHVRRGKNPFDPASLMT